jgi:hypothetical protein
MATMKEYEAMVSDRPEKFDAEEVNYRDSEKTNQKCGRCLHLFERKLDGLKTCEIFRSDVTDEEGVDEDYTCDFFTRNGTDFPLYEGD